MSSVKPISATELKTIASQGKVLILDVRTDAEIERSGRVPGARSIPAIEVPKKARPESAEFDPVFKSAQTIVVYCGVGVRSAAVAESLVKLGYGDVRDLGRFSYWADAGLPVEKA